MSYSGGLERKVVIIGGVQGATAAQNSRLDEHAEITVFERSVYLHTTVVCLIT